MSTPATQQPSTSTQSGHPPLTVQVKERATEFVQHCGEAVTSFAWLWPVRGIVFAVTNPKVFSAARPAILKSLLLSAGIFAALFLILYTPQAIFFSLFTGPLGPIIALGLVLAESVLVLNVFARQLFLGPALTEVFDATLRAQGQAELVASGRKALGGAGKGGDVGRALVRPLQGFTFDGILRYLLTLPFNFVPVVGTAFFLLYNGSRGGPGWHSRYFQLKQWDKQKRATFVHKRQPEYTAFGAATLLFNFIPFIGLVFAFTNTVGAALWAAQLEAGQNIIDAPGASGSKTETRKTQ